MHPREIARRTGLAAARINEAAAAIGEKLGLEPPNFGEVSPRRGGPDVARLRERELQAEYLEAIAEALPTGRKPSARKKSAESDGSTESTESADMQEIEGGSALPPPVTEIEGGS